MSETATAEAPKPGGFSTNIGSAFLKALGDSGVNLPADQPKPDDQPKQTAKESVGELVAKEPKKERKSFEDLGEKPEAKEKEKPSERARDEKGKFAANKAAEEAAKEPENEGIKSLRKAYEAAQKERDELKAKLQQTGAGIDIEEVEKLRARASEQEKILARVKYEATNEYQTKFVQPLSELVRYAKDLVPDEDQAAAIELLFDWAPSKRRTEALDRLIENATPGKQAELLRIAAQAASLVIERDKAKGNPVERLKEMETQAQARQKAQFEQQVKLATEVFDRTAGEAADAFEFFRKTGDPQHDANVDRRVKVARDFMLGNPDIEQISEMAFYASLGKESAALLPKAQAEIARLTKELEDLRSKRPAASGFSGGNQSSEKPNFFTAFMQGSQGG